MGASVAGGMVSQVPPLLLPRYLSPQALLWPGGQSRVCHLPCCSWVLCGCQLNCCSWGTSTAGTASTVSPVLRPLCVTVHPPLDVQVYGILVCWSEVSMLNCGCLMVVRCRGETKKASVFALMLMSLHSVHFKNIYWKTIYIKRSDQITHLH